MTEYPPVSLLVMTYEYYNNDWHFTLAHVFVGNTREEAMAVLNAHRTTDSFFDASFKGVFNYKGRQLILKSEIYG